MGQSTTLLASARTAFNRQRIDSERTKLLRTLYGLLERLPQSNHLKDNTEQLCRTIIDATDNLRFIWVGMKEQDGARVAPLAVEGEYVEDCDDWTLPDACFEFTAPFSQAALESAATPDDTHSLFAPWRSRLDNCSANCALAIPLRSERSGARGLMVFYSADIDYFSQLGAAPFQAFAHLVELLWRQANMLQLLTQKTQIDGLTGLMNRRRIVFMLSKAMEQAEAEQTPLSILVCRVDGFDKLNDVYGWFDADAILAAFAKLVATRMAPEVSAGRWTGVEFLYVLPGSDTAAATALAKSLQQYLHSQTISVKSWSIRLTVSIGVATHSASSNGLDDLIHQANHQMLPPA